MVKPTVQHQALSGIESHLPDWINGVAKKCDITDTTLLQTACNLSEKAGKNSPSPFHPSCFYQGLEMADTLANLQLDNDTLCAAILAPSVQYAHLPLDTVEEKLGNTIAKLTHGACQMAMLDNLSHTASRGQQHIDNVRKMMLAMVDHAGVVLIKLAERISIMNHIKPFDAATKNRMASDTLTIYAPLANRLGAIQIKWQLEDSSFACLHPNDYKNIAALLAEKRIDREKRITNFKEILQTKLQRAAIHADIAGRAKHIYSIYSKMKKKNLPYHEIYDISAVRILVDRIEDCYAALGIVHSTWDYIPSEFDDYISKPKPNGYQSIHTVIKDADDKLIEIQIRTHKMHEESEYGIAAHWKYKEGRTAQTSYEEKISRLRQLLAWHKELSHGATPLEEFHDKVFEDQIYVFTPAGDIVNLPKGATPLDFAYQIHTSLGHRCRGAKVDGKIVPLTYALKTGERVSIIKAREGGPSRDWLSPDAAYIITAKARNKIQHFFKQAHADEDISQGRLLLEKEFARHAISDISLEKVANELHFKNAIQLYAAVGHGSVRIGQVMNVITRLFPLQAPKPPEPLVHSKIKEKLPSKSRFSIQGVDNLLTHIAGCCKPLPGDEIVGYITMGRGVTIHRKNCKNLTNGSFSKKNRMIDVGWENKDDQHFQTAITLHATDRPDVANDIVATLTHLKTSVLSLQTEEGRDGLDIYLKIEISDLAALSRIMDKIAQIPGVLSIKRDNNT